MSGNFSLPDLSTKSTSEILDIALNDRSKRKKTALAVLEELDKRKEGAESTEGKKYTKNDRIKGTEAIARIVREHKDKRGHEIIEEAALKILKYRDDRVATKKIMLEILKDRKDAWSTYEYGNIGHVFGRLMGEGALENILEELAERTKDHRYKGGVEMAIGMIGRIGGGHGIVTLQALEILKDCKGEQATEEIKNIRKEFLDYTITQEYKGSSEYQGKVKEVFKKIEEVLDYRKKHNMDEKKVEAVINGNNEPNL
ncbi:MAG: hypothetical protein OEY94_03310 [Alphaproteobacteria bacterium]|nr:hypothetical protein [Alphaproteobacteria bacterium]